MRHERLIPGSRFSSLHPSGIVGRAARLPPLPAAFRQEWALPKGTHKERYIMKHKIEIFSAGCKTCKDTIATVKKLAGSEHEVIVHDMQHEEIAARAAQHGVRSVPAV